VANGELSTQNASLARDKAALESELLSLRRTSRPPSSAGRDGERSGTDADLQAARSDLENEKAHVAAMQMRLDDALAGERAAHKAEQQAAARSELAGAAVHELRQALGVALGAADQGGAAMAAALHTLRSSLSQVENAVASDDAHNIAVDIAKLMSGVRAAVDDVELLDAGATGGRAFIAGALGAVESTRSTVLPLMDGEHLAGLMDGDGKSPPAPADADGAALQAMETVAAQYRPPA
jgi:signal transduction histidine kinase